MRLELQDPVFEPLRATQDAIGCQAWAVGGYVRDLVLGRASTDLDIVVAAGRGVEMAEAFSQIYGRHPAVVFPRFGTAKATWGDRSVEFVSARSESYASDSRKPEVRAASIEEDLRRRDFTINALLMTLEGEIDDRLGTSLEDLRAGVLRCPTDPDITFTDDPLRMLRAVRFAAQLGFTLHPSVVAGIERNLHRLEPAAEGASVLSAERIRDELKKLLLSPRPALGLRLLADTGILGIILPELEACRGVGQNRWHKADVFEHTLEVVAGVAPELNLRLAALFHDTGKPATKTAGSDGEVHFYEHEQVSAELAGAALRRLRFDNDQVDEVRRLVSLHMRPVGYSPNWSDGTVRKLVRETGPLLEPLLELAAADLAAGAFPERSHVAQLRERAQALSAAEPARLSFSPDGNDIMAVLGLRAGPEVGRVKKEMEALILEGTLEPNRQAALEHLRGMAPEAEVPGI